MDVHDWLDDDGLEKLKADRQPFEAPSSHYTPKPNESGKMFGFQDLLELENQQQLNFWLKIMTLFTMKLMPFSCFVIHSLIPKLITLQWLL